ncbi:MAG: hypothetical protein E7Z91_05715 [Cyanobacteria bacterium SIG30]|nr:hypothetical protein [Cyanobacteria bacterium SIG30]
MKKGILFTFLFLFLFNSCVFAKNKEYDPNTVLQSKSFFDRVAFWKKFKKNNDTEKMPITPDEWLIRASSIPLTERENPKIVPKVNKKLSKVKERDSYILKYNIPAGGMEVNLSDVKKYSSVNSLGVADESLSKIAYVTHYYYPSTNQIASELYIAPLDKSFSKKDRFKKVNILNAQKTNLLKSGVEMVKDDYFSSLTILDWSKYANFILVKEKIGSLNTGLFTTNLYKVNISDYCETLSVEKIDFEEPIKNFWSNQLSLRLNFYRWDIKPLGFNAENEDEIIAIAYGYTKENKKVFLGAWSAILSTGEIILLSLDETQFDIVPHGLILKYEIP